MNNSPWEHVETLRRESGAAIARARQEIEAPWLSMDPKIAVGQLEASLETHLVLHFGADAHTASILLSSVPEQEPIARRSALLDLAALCLFLLANGQTDAFLRLIA